MPGSGGPLSARRRVFPAGRVFASRSYTRAVRKINVVTPTGDLWQVRVVWQPRWRALARRFGGWRRDRRNRRGGKGWDLSPGFDPGDELLVGIAVVVGMVVFGLLFWFLLVPLLLLVVDILVVFVLTVLAIPARVLLRRPWTVETVEVVAGGAPERFVTEVAGWRRALAVRDEIADRIRAGQPAAAMASSGGPLVG